MTQTGIAVQQWAVSSPGKSISTKKKLLVLLLIGTAITLREFSPIKIVEATKYCFFIAFSITSSHVVPLAHAYSNTALVVILNHNPVEISLGQDSPISGS